MLIKAAFIWSNYYTMLIFWQLKLKYIYLQFHSYLITIKMVFYLNIFLNVIYSCGVKLNYTKLIN